VSVPVIHYSRGCRAICNPGHIHFAAGARHPSRRRGVESFGVEDMTGRITRHQRRPAACNSEVTPMPTHHLFLSTSASGYFDQIFVYFPSIPGWTV